ncbi:nucleotide disphospho-sugar-binding domain-containing protein [Streptomyces reniochalinae]|uniref:DUF1205 domain-containing protein n=1 Tax=Streptomyces reniochalinae TaxID=2250578 RepID=A0A367E7R1_9ACTN|nr:nucleotide disphospho-sugar-binding domain-containing protein [Streptomyces reniochalinae]RCG13280.1 DUF1205 domain-containing protein [Streptomyces reniochalinae]
MLFVPLAAAGHFYTMVPLAWAFRVAGHDVRVAAQPSVLGLVNSSGLTAVPVGEPTNVLSNIKGSVDALRSETGKSLADYGDLESMPDEARERFKELRRETFVAMASEIADDLVGLARSWRPDLIVTDPVMFVGALLSEVTGAPLVRHLSGPLLPTFHRALGSGLTVDEWPASLLALFERFGAEPRPDPAMVNVDPTPPSLLTRPAANRVGFRYVPYNGATQMPGWLREPVGRPRVCVSWSMTNTVTSGEKEYPAAAIAKALVKRGVEVVVTVKATDRPHFGQVPDGVRIVEELPLQLVVPSCAAAVNHGGGGTSLTVVTSGTPQVMMPQDPAHVVNAERIATAGAGVAHRTRPIDIPAVVEAASDMVDDGRWRAAARAVQEENARQPSPAEAVRVLEQLVMARLR